MAKSFIFEVGQQSIAGVRPENQDRVTYFESRFGTVFAIADGMGGHQGGSLASSIAVSNLPGVMRDLPASLSTQDALVRAIEALDQLVSERSNQGAEHLRKMGSTLVALLLFESEAGLIAIGAHVGDSRLYFMRDGELFGLTQDHTVVQSLVSAGALTEEEAANHPQASVLTRALGHSGRQQVEVSSRTMVQVDDIFMLCSDGLTGYADFEEIKQVLRQDESTGEMARRLVNLAIERQSQDNISAMVIRIAMGD